MHLHRSRRDQVTKHDFKGRCLKLVPFVGPVERTKQTWFDASVDHQCRLATSTQFPRDPVRDFAICASNGFLFGAESEATNVAKLDFFLCGECQSVVYQAFDWPR